MSKVARKNQAKQLRIHHNEKKEHESNIFQGRDRAPKHVAVLSLSRTVDTSVVIKELNQTVEAQGQSSANGSTLVEIERFKSSLLYIPTSSDLLKALEICQIADWVMLMLANDQRVGMEEDVLLRAIEGQGITNVVVVVQGATAPKEIIALKREISRYFPTIDKLYSLSNKSDNANLVRSLCTATTKGIRWRDERSWMAVERCDWGQTTTMSSDQATVTLTGVVRGKPFNPDRLMHVPGWGDFQIGRVTEVPSSSRKRKADEMNVEETSKTHVPTSDRDDLAMLAPEEADMTNVATNTATIEHRGVLLDDHHYFSDDESHIPPLPTKLPKGTSSYQAAWYLDDVSDSESDISQEGSPNGDIGMDDAAHLGPEDGMVMPNGTDAVTEAGPSEYPESEMHVDAAPDEEAQELAEFRASRRTEVEEDLEFPDEIELHPNVLARERLAKYRGLKSLQTSEWNAAEDVPYQPTYYARLLQIREYNKSRKTATNEALIGCIQLGVKVQIELLAVPVALKSAEQPPSAFSLLRHEHKQTVVNLNMTLDSSVTGPVKSKEELVVQIGSRRLVINPLFSAPGQTPNDVHKYDRFLHPGRTAIATFTGPLTWGAVPVLVFKRQGPQPDDSPALDENFAAGQEGQKQSDGSFANLQLIGTATTIPPSGSRVIAKRVILTGHPYKIHKKLVTIRYMFFNKEDVTWFSALPLWTKRGRQGFIKESLGTHGYFKATFDGKINPMDAIGVSLYKRIWPRPAYAFTA